MTKLSNIIKENLAEIIFIILAVLLTIALVSGLILMSTVAYQTLGIKILLSTIVFVMISFSVSEMVL